MAGENPNSFRQRRFVLLAGNGKGPKVPFRSPYAVVRIRGLDNAGSLEVFVDETKHVFSEDGEFKIPGGQLAQATTVNNSVGVFCELLTSRDL